MTGGWYNEPQRHALAARGIPTVETRAARGRRTGSEKALRRAGYTSIEEARRAVVQSRMTPEELLAWKIDTTYSVSPDTAFEFRDDEELWTLDKVSVGDQQLLIDEALGRRWSREWRPTTHLVPKIKRGEKMTVYRSSDVGDIIPGSYVSESMEYASEHGRCHIPEDCEWRIYHLEVYPDELMWYGDPHEFIFIPRSPERWLEIARDRVKDIPMNIQEELLASGGGP
jgi:hypothetical protein